jgi:AcrR family transcriptional regulator
MAVNKREELVDAGMGMAAARRFQDLLAGIDTRSITDDVGVTTGSFFHHFRNRAHFAEAVVDRFVEQWEVISATTVAEIESITSSDTSNDVRSVAQADWGRVRRSDLIATVQHLLWSSRNEPISQDTSVTGAEVLTRCYRSLNDRTAPACRKVIAAAGREFMPPFDERDFAVALTALVDGLEMRWSVEPEAVREQLFADVVLALTVAVTRPAVEPARDLELAGLEAQLQQARPARTPAGDGEDGETWRQIADAAAPLFAGRQVRDVSVAEVAAAAGVSTSTVYDQFGTVSAVAACAWARHFPELQEISSAPLTQEQGPVARLEQLMARYAEIGQGNRGILEGLVTEVLTESGPGSAALRRRSIRTTIPMPSLLVPHVRELRTRGLLRRRIDGDELARSILQLVSMRVLMSPADPVERIVDETLGLLLEGALVRSGRS